MPRLTAISNRIINAGAKKSPVFIKIYSGTDFSSFHSTWTFSTGTISLRSSTLPYHSYGNPDELNIATNQSCNKTWPLRAGTNQGPILYTSTITTVSTTTNSSSIVLSSSVAGRDLGPDRSTLSTSWSFNNGRITLITDALPYHSYGNSPTNPNQPTRQNLTTIFANRAGTNVPAVTATTASSVIGYWLNGVYVGQSAVGFTTASAVTEYYPEWEYDVTFDLNESSELVFSRDLAGGYTDLSGRYQYVNSSFISSWLSGEGYTLGTAPFAYNTGTSEVDSIPYLNGNLLHPNGHSKILGWSLDGYPIYGPYGYQIANDPNSGIRTMNSSYALNTTRDPINAKLPEFLSIGDETFTVTNNSSTNYLIDGEANATLDLKRGFTYTFNLSVDGYPFFIKTTNTIGINDQYDDGVTNNGTQTGVITFVVPEDAPSILYYISQNHSSMSGTINITTYVPQTIYPLGTFVQDYNFDSVRGDLDEHNGRYCVTPDYPSGTYAYFVTVDPYGVPVYPYVIGPTFYGSPQVTVGGLTVPVAGGGTAPTALVTSTTVVTTSTVTTGTISTMASDNIGYWINGVNILNPSADAEAPNGYLSFDTLHYNASYTTAKYLSYSLEHDLAGGRVNPNGNYHYQDYSFASAWVSGTGSVTLSSGTAEVSVIPYLNNSLVQADGHSKILGWALDGYPIYGPYGYNQAMDCNSGIRPMTSGYTTYEKSSDVAARITEGAISTEVFPLGIFVEDWYFAGLGDLDISNGRYCVTPEYPLGTYAYFCSVDANTLEPTFPYVVGNNFKSTPVGAGQTASDTTNRGGSTPKQTG